MNPAAQVIDGRNLIIFNEYIPEDTPQIQNFEEAPNILAEYVPKDLPDTHKLKKDILEFKSSTDSKPAVEFLNAVEDLIYEKESLQHRNVQLTELVLKHAEAVYADMAGQLLSLVRASPELEKELNQLLEKKEHFALQELVGKLNVPRGEQVANINQTDLEALNDQISLLSQVGRETQRPQTVLLKVNEFRNQIHPAKTSWASTALKGLVFSSWVTGKVLSLTLNMCIALTPSIIALLPSFFPALWLDLLALLMGILYKKAPITKQLANIF